MKLLEIIYKEIIQPFLYLWGLFYLAPYLIRKGWGDAENKTKKVCDVCFRDIKAWNKKVEEEKTKKIKNLMEKQDNK